MDGSRQVAPRAGCQQQEAVVPAVGVASAQFGDRATGGAAGPADDAAPIVYRPAKRVRAFDRHLAEEQRTACRQRLVYLNTLAVTTVGHHLSRLGFTPDLKLSDSCSPNSYSRKLFNVADLLLSEIGVLECRPVLPDQVLAVMPPQECFDRLAVTLVEIDDARDLVKILGFALPARKHQRLPLFIPRHLLHPPRHLGAFLKRRQLAASAIGPVLAARAISRVHDRLRGLGASASAKASNLQNL